MIFLSSSKFYPYEMIDISGISCNFFTIYVNQTIRVYILNEYSDVCQLFLNKTRKKIKVDVG